MSTNVKLHRLGRGLSLCIRKKTFHTGGRKLIVEDVIPVFRPWRSTRLLMIAGTNAYYSEVPLLPFRHRLPCYAYTAGALKNREPSFYRHALVLGLGGGTVPRWLLEEYPNLSVDVVDVSSTILHICQEYFLQKWQNSERLTYFCTDARDYEAEDGYYQFIFCDLFDGEAAAPFIYHPAFVRKLRKMLCKDGILLVNCGWEADQTKLTDVYRPLFPQVKNVERQPWQTTVLMASSGPLDENRK